MPQPSKYALKFHVSFYVLALLMMLGGRWRHHCDAKDVLPTVDIPVVVVVWTRHHLYEFSLSSRDKHKLARNECRDL
jgi:hypothetical protein